ncbi:MAG: hypothetical protein ACKO1M_02225 [Planctomycetota bacterium]
MPAITLSADSGPLELDLAEGTLVTEFRGPPGVAGPEAARLVTDAVGANAHGPPLAAHVVPGDRAAVAVSGDLPQAEAVLSALRGCLATGGVAEGDVTVLVSAPLDTSRAAAPPAGAAPFDPAVESTTAYLAADAEARPLYVSRVLVDADVVVAVGRFAWDAALGGRSPEGELWPAFGRLENRESLARELARRGRDALVDWRGALHDITWQLGVCASLRLVPGRGDTLHAACFGLPEEATRAARAAAAAWRPAIEEPADLAIATLAGDTTGFGGVVRAIAAAARVTRPSGTIVVVAGPAATPGIVLTRARQGTPLGPLVREALASGDPALIADAVEARLLARCLGDRRVVLFSTLEEAAVEEIGFGHADDAGVVERLANRAEQVVVLHEADRMFPRR